MGTGPRAGAGELCILAGCTWTNKPDCKGLRAAPAPLTCIRQSRFSATKWNFFFSYKQIYSIFKDARTRFNSWGTNGPLYMDLPLRVAKPPTPVCVNGRWEVGTGLLFSPNPEPEDSGFCTKISGDPRDRVKITERPPGLGHRSSGRAEQLNAWLRRQLVRKAQISKCQGWVGGQRAQGRPLPKWLDPYQGQCFSAGSSQELPPHSAGMCVCTGSRRRSHRGADCAHGAISSLAVKGSRSPVCSWACAHPFACDGAQSLPPHLRQLAKRQI